MDRSSMENSFAVTSPLIGKRRRKPSRWRQTVLMLACLYMAFFSVGLGFGLSVTYVEIIGKFGSTRAEAAAIQSIYFGILNSGGIVWALFITKLGLGQACILGASISTAGLAFTYLASSTTTFLLLVGVIAGIGVSFLTYASLLTVKWIFSENSGPMSALLIAGCGLGAFVMPLLTELLLEAFFLNGIFLIFSGFALNCVLCGLVIYFAKYDFPMEAGYKSGAPFSRIHSALLCNGVFGLVIVCTFILFTTGTPTGYFIVDIMVQRGFDQKTGSLFVSLMGLGSLCGRILGGMLLYFLSVHELVHSAILLLIISVSHGLILYLYTYEGLLGACLLNGLGVGAALSVGPSMVLKVTGSEAYSHAIAIYTFFSGIGNIIAGIIGGFINDKTGSYDLWLLVSMGTSVLASVMYISNYGYIKIKTRNFI